MIFSLLEMPGFILNVPVYVVSKCRFILKKSLFISDLFSLKFYAESLQNLVKKEISYFLQGGKAQPLDTHQIYLDEKIYFFATIMSFLSFLSGCS